MKKVFYILGIILLFSSCSTQDENVKKYFHTAQVSSGTLDLESSYVGYIESEESAQLAFKSPGRITHIYAGVGQEVKKGELLAELDGIEAKTGYSSSADIISQLLELKTSTALSYDKQIESMEAQIRQIENSEKISETSLQGAIKSLEDTQSIISDQIETIKIEIAQAELGQETLEIQYKNTQSILEQKEKDIRVNAQNAITSAQTLGTNIFDFLDTIFSVTEENRNKNKSFEIYLGAKDWGQKNETETILKKGIETFLQIKNESKNNISEENIEKQLEVYYHFFNNDIKKILTAAYETLENSVATVSFPENQISNIKKTITDFQQQNEAIILSVSGNYILGLKGSLDNIISIQEEKKLQLDALEKQIENSKKQKEMLEKKLRLSISQGDENINQANTGLKIQEIQNMNSKNMYDEARAGLNVLKEKKNASLFEIEAKIYEVRASQKDAGVMIQNTKIYAPFSGVITEKMYEEGEIIGSGMPVMSLNNKYIVKIHISVSDEIIQSLEIGKTVKVQIEGYHSEYEFTVSNIYPAKDEITKKTPIELIYDNTSEEIKLGSYAHIFFKEQSQIESGIIIPNIAIISKYMIPGVYLVEDGKVKFQKIYIKNQNDSFSLVEGLSLGDTIVTNGKEFLYDGENF